jgi:hypothetical protein
VVVAITAGGGNFLPLLYQVERMVMKLQLTLAILVLMALTTGAQVASHVPARDNALPPARMMSPQVTGKTVARVNGVGLSDRDLVREMFIFPYAKQHNGFPIAGAADLQGRLT